MPTNRKGKCGNDESLNDGLKVFMYLINYILCNAWIALWPVVVFWLSAVYFPDSDARNLPPTVNASTQDNASTLIGPACQTSQVANFSLEPPVALVEGMELLDQAQNLTWRENDGYETTEETETDNSYMGHFDFFSPNLTLLKHGGVLENRETNNSPENAGDTDADEMYIDNFDFFSPNMTTLEDNGVLENDEEKAEEVVVENEDDSIETETNKLLSDLTLDQTVGHSPDNGQETGEKGNTLQDGEHQFAAGVPVYYYHFVEKPTAAPVTEDGHIENAEGLVEDGNTQNAAGGFDEERILIKKVQFGQVDSKEELSDDGCFCCMDVEDNYDCYDGNDEEPLDEHCCIDETVDAECWDGLAQHGPLQVECWDDVNGVPVECYPEIMEVRLIVECCAEIGEVVDEMSCFGNNGQQENAEMPATEEPSAANDEVRPQLTLGSFGKKLKTTPGNTENPKGQNSEAGETVNEESTFQNLDGALNGEDCFEADPSEDKDCDDEGGSSAGTSDDDADELGDDGPNTLETFVSDESDFGDEEVLWEPVVTLELMEGKPNAEAADESD